MAGVYCYGHVSTSRILRLKDRYPEADGYGEIVESLENHSGEATGTALVLNRLGVPVALEGNWIGDNPECRRTLEFLRGRGIDCSGLRVVPGYVGATELVVSDGATRTVFGRYLDLLFTTKQWDDADPAKIAAARVACIDSTFGESTLAAARQAAAHTVPVVTFDPRHDAELTRLSAVVIISGELIRREYPAAAKSEDERARLFEAYRQHCPGLVVFTAGARPIWWARGAPPAGGGARHEQAPFHVDVVDSAGAGDSFRGGIIYGMLRGWSDAECVRFAAATAALICTRAPGCVNPPSLEEIQALMASEPAPRSGSAAR